MIEMVGLHARLQRATPRAGGTWGHSRCGCPRASQPHCKRHLPKSRRLWPLWDCSRDRSGGLVLLRSAFLVPTRRISSRVEGTFDCVAASTPFWLLVLQEAALARLGSPAEDGSQLPKKVSWCVLDGPDVLGGKGMRGVHAPRMHAQGSCAAACRRHKAGGSVRGEVCVEPQSAPRSARMQGHDNVPKAGPDSIASGAREHGRRGQQGPGFLLGAPGGRHRQRRAWWGSCPPRLPLPDSEHRMLPPQSGGLGHGGRCQALQRR